MSTFELFVGGKSDADVLLRKWLGSGVTARAVRGEKMRSSQGLMDEVAAALQFPYYFGENWAALDECMSDLEWLLPADSLVILIYDAGQVLSDESIEVLNILSRILRDAAEEFSVAIEGTTWDRLAVPFSVVLQVAPHEESVIRDRWAQTGVELGLLRP